MSNCNQQYLDVFVEDHFWEVTSAVAERFDRHYEEVLQMLSDDWGTFEETDVYLEWHEMMRDLWMEEFSGQ